MQSDAPCTEATPERLAVSHVDVTPLASRATPEATVLAARLAAYVARVGLLASAATLGVARPTLERALGGLRVLRAIERQIVAGLDADDAARRAPANTNEGIEGK